MSEDESVSKIEVAVIKEVYDSESAHEAFELELERVLEAGVKTIVIEPTALGDETARWIAVGNCLHKTAVVSGIGSILAGVLWRESVVTCVPLGALSVFCSCVYAVSWQFDPCCKYQVEHDSRRLSSLLLHSLSTATPIVLVRRNDSRRKILHSLISGISASFCIWRIYKLYQ